MRDSPESRAAARLLARERADRRERLEFIIRGDVGPHATPWMEDHNGIRMPVRCLCMPEGMSLEEARLVVEGKCQWKTDLL